MRSMRQIDSSRTRNFSRLVLDGFSFPFLLLLCSMHCQSCQFSFVLVLDSMMFVCLYQMQFIPPKIEYWSLLSSRFSQYTLQIHSCTKLKSKYWIHVRFCGMLTAVRRRFWQIDNFQRRIKVKNSCCQWVHIYSKYTNLNPRASYEIPRTRRQLLLENRI